MGLDQYLSIKIFLGGYSSSSAEERNGYQEITRLLKVQDIACKDSPYVYAEVNVGYWRKANSIHKWFVENVQKGVDDCGTYCVSFEKLDQLKETCQKVLDARGTDTALDTSLKLLPPTSGFFFGSTEVGEYYYNDIEYTVELLTKLLTEENRKYDFYYHSSW